MGNAWTRDDYREWRQARSDVAGRETIEALIVWQIEHPSPMLSDGLASSGADVPPSRETCKHYAIYDALNTYRGRRIRLSYTDTPEASSRLVWETDGTIMGLGTLAAEPNGTPRRLTDTVVLETAGSQYLTVRLASIIGVEAL